MKKSPLLVLLLGLFALVAVPIAGPASAAPPPHPVHPTQPVHPPHPGSNPTVVTSTVDVPVTCSIGPAPVIFATTADVSVTAPTDTYPNAPYAVSFLVSLDGVVNNTPEGTVSIVFTSTYNVSGPVDPNGAIVFPDGPQSVAEGDSPTFNTFTQTFTPGSQGTISYQFDAFAYDFHFTGGTNIHADCALDGGPVDVAQTGI